MLDPDYWLEVSTGCDKVYLPVEGYDYRTAIASINMESLASNPFVRVGTRVRLLNKEGKQLGAWAVATVMPRIDVG